MEARDSRRRLRGYRSTQGDDDGRSILRSSVYRDLMRDVERPRMSDEIDPATLPSTTTGRRGEVELPRSASPSSRTAMSRGGDGGDATRSSGEMAWSGENSERFSFDDSIVLETSKGAASSPRKKLLGRMFRAMLSFTRKGGDSPEKAPSQPPEEEVMLPNKVLEERLRLWNGVVRFSRKQLRTATRNFSPTRLISRDDSKIRYAGNLLGKRVEILRFEFGDKEKLFLSEVHALSMLRHQNIVRGVGWCREGGEIFVVHEAMENGTLFDHLHLPDGKSLPWDVRFKIALDLALAILYMHEQCEHCILHRDIKSANVLLDSEFNAKLTSFELAMITDHQEEDVDTVVVGTMGYLDPQYAMTGALTRGSDVYSFGVVVLEIASGRKALGTKSTGSLIHLVEEVGCLYSKEEISAVADERLSGEFDPEQMKQLITVGIQCTRPNHNMRPTIQEVVRFLKFGVALPNKMVVPSPLWHSSPRSRMSLIPDIEEELLDQSKGMHLMMDQPEICEKPIAAEETVDKIEKPVLDDEPSFTRETLDIGIPSSYNGNGPLNDPQLQIMKGFVATLHENIESGFTDVLQTIKKFTSILLTLHVPLREWDSLAQHVLAEVQRMEAFRGKHEEVEHQRARTLSSLRARFEECLATIDEDSAKLAEAKEKLVSMEQERVSSMSKLDDLQKQLAELQNQMEGVERTSNLSQDSVEIINRWRAQNIERIEYIESAILTLHESLLSRVLSFPFGDHLHDAYGYIEG